MNTSAHATQRGMKTILLFDLGTIWNIGILSSLRNSGLEFTDKWKVIKKQSRSPK